MAELPRTRRADLLFDVPSQTPIRALSTSQVRRVGLDAASDYQKTLAQTNVNVQKMLAPIVQNYAETSAYEYVANRPLTKEQILKAKSGDVTEIKGSPLTVRGQVINKLRALEVANRLTIEVEKNLLGLLPDIENGVLSTDEAEIKIQEILDGASGSVKQLDPEVNLRLRANLARTGNNILTKAYDAQIKKNQQLSIASANTALDSLSVKILNITGNIKNYPKMENGQIVETLDQAIAAEVENTISILSTLPLPPSLAANIYKSVSTRKDAAIEDGLKALLTSPEYVEKNGGYYQILTQLSQNIVPDVEGNKGQDIALGILWNTIPSRHAAIEQHVYQANNRQINFEKAQQAKLKEEKAKQKIDLITDGINLVNSADPEDQLKLIDIKQKLVDNHNENPRTVTDLFRQVPNLSNRTGFRLRQEIYNGDILSLDELFARVEQLNGNGADLLEYIPLVTSQRKEELRELERLLGVYENASNDYQHNMNNTIRKAALSAESIARAEANEKNIPFDRLEWFREYVANKQPALKSAIAAREYSNFRQNKLSTLLMNSDFRKDYRNFMKKRFGDEYKSKSFNIDIEQGPIELVDALPFLLDKSGNPYFTEEDMDIIRDYMQSKGQ